MMRKEIYLIKNACRRFNHESHFRNQVLNSFIKMARTEFNMSFYKSFLIYKKVYFLGTQGVHLPKLKFKFLI